MAKVNKKRSIKESSGVLTREVLREELGLFRKEVQQEFKTVRGEIGSLREEVRQEFGDVRNEMDKRFLEVDDNARKYRDEVLTKVVDFAGKYAAKDEESVIQSYQTSELQKEVDDHEKRLKRLEKAKN